MPLHLTKIAFRSNSPAELRSWLESHAPKGEAKLTTRYRPRREDELQGGSLFWIMNGMLIGRSPILGFADNGQGRVWIRLSPILISVAAVPRRAHQGWRYLEEGDAPSDVDYDIDQRDQMPLAMRRELSELALI